MRLTLASSAIAFVIAVAAGAFGSVLGIGGGLFVIPSLTLFLGVKLKTAIAASIVAVIATSLSGGNVYVRQRVANIRLGLPLALATAPSAVVGAILATYVNSRVLAGVFALVLAASGFRMARSTGQPAGEHEDGAATDAGDAAIRGEYVERTTGETIHYRVVKIPTGIAASTVAGLISGLLGVGGGIVQVPVMNLIMRVPIKVATTTSTYIIGITAMAGAFVYYNHRPSFIDPGLVVPVSLGIFIGAAIGSAILGRVTQSALRTTFTAVLAIYTVQMALRVFGIGG